MSSLDPGDELPNFFEASCFRFFNGCFCVVFSPGSQIKESKSCVENQIESKKLINCNFTFRLCWRSKLLFCMLFVCCRCRLIFLLGILLIDGWYIGFGSGMLVLFC